MKNMIKLPVVILGLMLLLTGVTQKAVAQNDDISLQSFYDELSPYGTWMQDPQYGYVWRPDVDQSDFRPYYNNGRWAMTEYGNTWVSDYDWGWAPFHYGRWITNRFNQWVWIPDTEWGPAWVSWRSGGGYFGWAPLGPGFNININIGGGGYRTPNDWWVFIPQRNIYSDRYSRYTNRRNVTIINQTTIINNTYNRNRSTYYTGPRASDIRRATNRDVTVYNINRSDRPGRTSINNNNINIYNPRGNRGQSTVTTGRDDRPAYPGRGNNQGQNSAVGGRDGRNGGNQQIPDRSGRTDGTNTTPVTVGRSSRDGQTPQQQTQRWNQQTPNRDGRTDGTPVNNGSRSDNPVTTTGRSTRDSQTPQDQNPRWNQQNDAQQQQQRQQRDAQRQQNDAQQQQQRDAQQQRQQNDAQQQQQRDAQQQQQRQQRDAQQQQQRDAQQQQQQQRDAQQQQQRQQRDAQQQQQRDAQQQQQRQQRDAQQQQQRDAQQQQQRQQHDAQQQQQRAAQQQQQRQQHDAQQQQQRQQREAQQQQNKPARSSENSGDNNDARRGGRN